MSRLREQRKVELQGLQWLCALLAEQTPGSTKTSPEQRQHDALLATDCYIEWEDRVAFSSFEREERNSLSSGSPRH